jgi:hypothetical protein
VDFRVLLLLIAQKIGQTFRNLIKKKQLSVSDGSGVINFLMKLCNPTILTKGDSKLKIQI